MSPGPEPSRVKFDVVGPLRSATREPRVEVDVDGGTVADALSAFVEAYPHAASQLYDDGGRLRPSVRVSRDGTRLDPEDPCSNDDTLTLVPAMRGG